MPQVASGKEIIDNIQTDEECVYLTALQTESNFYMERAVKYFGAEGITVKVEVSKYRLEPDDNSIYKRNSLDIGSSKDDILFGSMKF